MVSSLCFLTSQAKCLASFNYEASWRTCEKAAAPRFGNPWLRQFHYQCNAQETPTSSLLKYSLKHSYKNSQLRPLSKTRYFLNQKKYFYSQFKNLVFVKSLPVSESGFCDTTTYICSCYIVFLGQHDPCVKCTSLYRSIVQHKHWVVCSHFLFGSASSIKTKV